MAQSRHMLRTLYRDSPNLLDACRFSNTVQLVGLRRGDHVLTKSRDRLTFFPVSEGALGILRCKLGLLSTRDSFSGGLCGLKNIPHGVVASNTT